MPDILIIAGRTVTAEEAEQHLRDYLKIHASVPISMWSALNGCGSGHPKKERRRIRQFYLEQLQRMVRENKVKRYYTVRFRHKIRINEAYARYGRTHPEQHPVADHDS